MVDIPPRGGPEAGPKPAPKAQKKRLIGIDAARGLALIGLMAIHILPEEAESGGPSLTWTLFAGDSAALFALLAGVGLALSTGGRAPHQGRTLMSDQVGLAVRAVIIGIIALVIAALQPEDPPVVSILLYYAVFFLLAIPFLALRPMALFISAGVFAVVSPLLMQSMYEGLPDSSGYNHTLVMFFTEPTATLSELLLTGAYPALTFMAFILAGLGLGRLDLRSTRVQAMMAGIGAAMAIVANLVSSLLLYAFGGYGALLDTEDMTMDSLDDALAFGPDILYNTSFWWQAIATPHSGTTLAIASSLGIAMAALGVLLLLGARYGRFLTPLAAMGSMTLTLYSTHLLALIPEVHYEAPVLWFVVQVGAAAAFAWFWHQSFRRGPLETVVHRAVDGARTVTTSAKEASVREAAGAVQGGNVTGRSAENPGESPHRPPSSSSDG
ncbi:heparan-alpha-glucosaminide N-acetyltransferase domain-containing protein [Citricoccus sp. CH26A]|uniref:heparan-alpha-glucosaminide N-acetyltransferase domain-containing protein n=1 Tax=Citricoccus TaxID=169133 RepID=UPI0003003AA3|nr:heparan-alpha-glucosaminide N-acetyltransferase domain-containing protein [Citricoccus sp. CH26A]